MQKQLVDGYRDLPSRIAPINGFCLAARAETWDRYRYDSDHVFHPGPRYKMIRNEDWFCGQIRNAGGKTGFVCSSFVLHYRGVSRPDGRRGKESKGMLRPK